MSKAVQKAGGAELGRKLWTACLTIHYDGLQRKLRSKRQFEGKKPTLIPNLTYLPDRVSKVTITEKWRRDLWVEGEKGRFWTCWTCR